LPRRLALAALLIVYIGLAVAYSLANPLYEAPDELRHVRYVRHMSRYRSLPVQTSDGPRAQSHHPPLYYAMGALLSSWVPVEEDVYYQPKENPFWAYRYWEVGSDNKNQYVHGPQDSLGILPVPRLGGIALAVYVVRWMTVLMGGVVVWLTYRIGLRIFPNRPSLALGGAALVALNPQFLYLSGAVNNDVPAAVWGAAASLVCVQIVQDGLRRKASLVLGVVFGLGLLTKIHVMVLLAPIELALAVVAWRERDWRGFLEVNGLILGAAALIAGWWFVRNQVLYGDPLGVSVHSELWNSRSPFEGLWAVRQDIPYLWSSFWGRFGYGQVVMPPIVYRGVLALSVIGLVGHILPRERSLQPLTALILVTTVVVFLAWVVYYIRVQPAGARGRFLFPALPAFAVLIASGLGRIQPVGDGWPVSLAVIGCLLALSVYALGWILIPAFAPPEPLDAVEMEGIPNPMAEDFRPAGRESQPVARLRGYRVQPKEFAPGDVVEVTLYWQPLARTEREHVVFVHLLSETGVMIAQRDTYPGLGRFSTTAWEPGVVIADTYRIHVSETAYAPDRGRAQVGLYAEGGSRLEIDGGRAALQLSSISVRPRPGDVPNPVSINLSDKLELIGYSLDERALAPGETVSLTLYWRALSPMEINYELFVHVLGEKNQIWANNQGPITDRATCTNRWETGVVVEEQRELTLADDTPIGFYELELGVYAPAGGRLKVLGDDGREVSNRIFLTPIRVAADE
jgi:4-amino-4-deoxy-L-arabinose transferase-like glycosyltransferase